MTVRYQYFSDSERQSIMSSRISEGCSLTKEEKLLTGNFLTFLTKDELDMNTVVEKTLHAFFNHENRIRALEGKAAITREQFIAAVKNL